MYTWVHFTIVSEYGQAYHISDASCVHSSYLWPKLDFGFHSLFECEDDSDKQWLTEGLKYYQEQANLELEPWSTWFEL